MIHFDDDPFPDFILSPGEKEWQDDEWPVSCTCSPGCPGGEKCNCRACDKCWLESPFQSQDDEEW